MKVLILGGGSSPERDVSIRSAAAVRDVATDLGHNVTYLDPMTIPVDEIVASAKRHDAVLPILHGSGGEDGELQGIFSDNDIKHFLGSGTEACERTFNKSHYKTLLADHQLPTPAYEIVDGDAFFDSPLIRRPFVLKPIEGGSSIDTFVIRVLPFDSAPIVNALEHYGAMLLEELIEGPELTVAILDTVALPVVEIIPPVDGEFDYENKYNGATHEYCPPINISDAIQAQAQELALKVHRAAGCSHLSRTDIMIDHNNNLYLIDTNVIPGLTSQSLYPKAARTAGYAWKELVEAFITLASKQKST